MSEEQKPQDENLGSFYVGRRPPPPPERVLPKGGLSVLALVAFAAIIWYAYPTSEEAQEAADVPVVLAEKAAYKFTPDDPGGMKVPHQDSTVFDPLDNKGKQRVERLLPGTEEPVNKDEVIKTVEGKAATPDSNLKKVGIATEKVIAPEKEPAKETAAEKPVQKPAVAKTADAPAVKAAAAKPAEQAAKSVATSNSSAGGTVYIQLGSYRNTEGAATDWKKLQQKHPELLKGLDMRTQRIDLGAKGVFNRLQAGKLSEARAREICDVLKSANPGGCMVVR
ncbi:MAG TPA: SPOR domain-containing protein [Alphaproteobacteria bacterium]|nr:hypothetical protein [Rhodospirillaceae bacterium]HRJ66928.1 SPOR domain-containing protein [Alphaproteobacteria bacterium]